MKIELTAAKSSITIRCNESSIEVSDNHLDGVLEQFKNALYEAIYQRWKANKTTDEDVWIIGPSEWDDNKSGLAEFIEDYQYQKHRTALEKAFVAAYPKTNHGVPFVQIPYHECEDKEWDEAQRLAEIGLIANGKDDEHWVAYIKSLKCYTLMMYSKESEQVQEWQRWHDLGLPILPLNECRKILKKQGFEGFTKLLKLE